MELKILVRQIEYHADGRIVVLKWQVILFDTKKGWSHCKTMVPISPVVSLSTTMVILTVDNQTKYPPDIVSGGFKGCRTIGNVVQFSYELTLKYV